MIKILIITIIIIHNYNYDYVHVMDNDVVWYIATPFAWAA